jgi:hypothetical protein
VRTPALAIVLVLAAAAMVGCDTEQDQDPTGPTDGVSGWAAPSPGLCDELASAAGLDAEVDEVPDSDQRGVTCTLRTVDARVDVVARVGDRADAQYEMRRAELDAEPAGFTGASSTSLSVDGLGPQGEGRRIEAVQAGSVRLRDAFHASDLFVELQWVGDILEGDSADRQAATRAAADRIESALVDLLAQ